MRWVVEEVVGRMLCDIHFVVIKGMNRKVTSRMRRVRVHGVFEVRREEVCGGSVVRRQG